MRHATAQHQSGDEPDRSLIEPRDHEDGGNAPEGNPFLWVILRMFRDLQKTISTVDFSNKADFQHAMWIFVHGFNIHTSTFVREIKEEGLEWSIDAIEAWAVGRTAPHSTASRQKIIALGLEILKRDGLKMAGKVYDPCTGKERVRH